jgi:hypothetical protein
MRDGSFISGGGSGGVDSFEKRKEVASIKDEGLGLNEKPDYATIKATVNYIKHDNDCWYTACPTEGCNKKVSLITTAGADVLRSQILRYFNFRSLRQWATGITVKSATKSFPK